MRTIKTGLMLLIFSSLAATGFGCYTDHQHPRAYRATVREPAGAVYPHSGYDHQNGYYDSRGVWHEYPHPIRP